MLSTDTLFLEELAYGDLHRDDKFVRKCQLSFELTVVQKHSISQRRRGSSVLGAYTTAALQTLWSAALQFVITRENVLTYAAKGRRYFHRRGEGRSPARHDDAVEPKKNTGHGWSWWNVLCFSLFVAPVICCVVQFA